MGVLKRSLEDHALTTFHAEKFKQEAEVIRNVRQKKKKKNNDGLKQGILPCISLSNGEHEDNMLRNFIRSCVIGGHIKTSPRQTYAQIAGAALADGLLVPFYGYNNCSE